MEHRRPSAPSAGSRGLDCSCSWCAKQHNTPAQPDQLPASSVGLQGPPTSSPDPSRTLGIFIVQITHTRTVGRPTVFLSVPPVACRQTYRVVLCRYRNTDLDGGGFYYQPYHRIVLRPVGPARSDTRILSPWIEDQKTIELDGREGHYGVSRARVLHITLVLLSSLSA